MSEIKRAESMDAFNSNGEENKGKKLSPVHRDSFKILLDNLEPHMENFKKLNEHLSSD